MSFRLKIVLGIVLIQALLLVILVTISLKFLRLTNEIELTTRASSLASIFAVTLREAVRGKDSDAIIAEARVMAGQPGVVYARVVVDGKIYYAGDPEQRKLPFVEDDMYEDVDDGVFDAHSSVIEANGTVIGDSAIGLSVRQIANVMDAARRQITMIAIFGMCFSVIMAIFLGNYFARQLKNLRDATRSIASGNIGYQMYMKGDDELAQTANAFNTMSRKLAMLYSEKQAALNESEDKATNLREKERRLKAILENAGDGIITIDIHGDIESFNVAAERMFGYSQSDVLGENVKMLMDEPYSIEHDGYLSRYLETGEKRLMGSAREVRGRDKNGKIFPMELDVSEMSLEGQRLFIGIARDISQRKLAENELRKAQAAALEAARAKFEFIANISHEIRSPMNGVLTMINLLDDSELSEEQRNYVGVIHDSGSALITIINDILDFSRLEAGQLDLESIEFDLEQMIEDVCRLLHANATSKGLELVHMLEGNVPTALVGDPARIRQILVNLVDNAIKFTDKGSVTVRISVVEEQGDSVMLHFAVIDTGIGLSSKAQRSIIDGSEEDIATSGEYRPGSTGLGLAISRKLVSLLAGEIGIESELGSGSTFWLNVSLLRQSSLVRDTEPHYSQLNGLKALVIDNREAWSGFLKDQMDTIEMEVSLAADYRQGIDILRKATEQNQPFDLVIFDMMIMEASGLDLAARIRSDSRIKHLRMIMVATTGYRGDSEEVRRVGIMGYLTTPVSSAQLYECISAVMRLADDDEDTLITRHSLADTRASQRTHVLLMLDNTADLRHLLLQVQGLGYRVHYITDMAALVTASNRHYYGCIVVDWRGLKPEMCHDHISALRSSLNVEHEVKFVALIEENDQLLGPDYLAAGASTTLVWPVQVDILQDSLNDCYSQ
jgi:PAS domain S-box-containing protein